METLSAESLAFGTVISENPNYKDRGNNLDITKSFNVILIATALVLSLVLTFFAAQREYQLALAGVVEQSQNKITGHPELQLHILAKNKPGLREALGSFLEIDAVTQALGYSNQSEFLASRERDEYSSPAAPSLQLLRNKLSVTATGLSAIDSGQQNVSTGFLAALQQSPPPLYMTLPVLSTLDASYAELPAGELMSKLVTSSRQGSLPVIGFLTATIDRNVLVASLLPAALQSFFISLALLMLGALTVHLVMRKRMAPLSEIKEAAAKVIAGEAGVSIDVRGNNEFSNIARALNLLLMDTSKQTQQLGLEKKILTLKADESASELSERDRALSRATDEIDATRKQLHQLANYDALTGLPNRNLFTTQLALFLRLSKRSAKPLALLCLNLNDFSRVNESLGHSTGDLVLREVAKRLVGCLRSSDILGHYAHADENINISRLSGDEFAIVLNELDTVDSAGIVAQRIIDNLGEPMAVEGHELVVTPSIGIAVAPADGIEVESLLRSANVAMQQSESANQARCQFYHSDMEPTGPDELKLELALRKAIERGELCIHYQPQVDTVNGAITSVEALLRWQHPDMGDVSPSLFIPLAERIGMIREIGNWVLLKACRQMKAFENQGLELPRLAINISPQQLNHEFVKQLGEVLESVSLSPALLELGLSEGVLMGNDSSVLDVLREFKELGVYLSLDNFGTQYAHLGNLGHYPLDEIKIDRRFIKGCDKNTSATRLALAVIAMTRSLGLDTVAEGVETEEEFRFLVDREVRFMRGYLFSKPLPAEQLQELLATPWYFMKQVQRMRTEAGPE